MFAWVLILVAWVLFLSLILHDVTKDEVAGSAVSIAARKIRGMIAAAVIRFRKSRRARAKAVARARAEKEAALEADAAAASSAPEPITVEPVSAELVPAEPMSVEPMSAEPASAELAPVEPTSVETVSPEIAPSVPTAPETSEPETPRHAAPGAIKLAPEVIKQVSAQAASTPKKKWWRPQDDRAAKTIPEIENAITHAVKSAAPDCEDFVGVIVRQTTPKSRHDVNWELQGIRFGRADKKVVNDALRGIIKQMQREYRVPDQ